MFGNRGYGGRGYRYQNGGSVLGGMLAAEAEVEVIEDLMEGDPLAAMEDQQAANDFARGDFAGGFMDEMIADVL